MNSQASAIDLASQVVTTTINGFQIERLGPLRQLINLDAFQCKQKVGRTERGRIVVDELATSLLSQYESQPNLGLLDAFNIAIPRSPLGPASTVDRLPHPPSLHLCSFIVQNRIGMIEYKDVYYPKVCAEIANAFPDSSFAIICKNKLIAKEIVFYTKLYGENSVKAINSNGAPSWETRVVAGPPLSMGHNSVEFEKRDIILFPDALSALHENSKTALCAPDIRGRLLGLIHSNHPVTESQRKKLAATFGFHNVKLPKYGHERVEVKVRLIPFQDCMPTGKSKRVKRMGVVCNDKRNRLICAEGKKLFRQGLRVLVLAESIEHLSRLAPLLTDWPAMLSSPAKIDELPDEVRQRFQSNLVFADGSRFISTVDSLGRFTSEKFDAIVWASASPAPPVIPEYMLVAPTLTNQELLLVDLMDRHHPMLRRWANIRRRGYHDQFGSEVCNVR